MELSFCKAGEGDAVALANLVNAAYRGDASRKGWTTEADLLEGSRTDVDEVLALMTAADSLFLLCKTGAQLLGSVHLQLTEEGVHLGMLAVQPSHQGQNIGKALLSAAEHAARHMGAADCIVMEVITCRHELIAFYQRLGYQSTGVIRPFPLDPAFWKVADLQLVVLAKSLV